MKGENKITKQYLKIKKMTKIRKILKNIEIHHCKIIFTMYIDRIYVEIHICNYKAVGNSVIFAMGNLYLNLKRKEKSKISTQFVFLYNQKAVYKLQYSKKDIF